MKSISKILLLAFTALSVSFCSSTPETNSNAERADEDVPKYEDYTSSGVYQDIEQESRSIASTEYEDDDYGDINAADDKDEELYLGGNIENESEPEPMPESLKESAELPVETLDSPAEEEEPAPAPKGHIAKFKNGMYKFSKACFMRKKPSKSAGTSGKVSTKRKLWVEGHNSNWVTVQKKAGPVYVHRTCL